MITELVKKQFWTVENFLGSRFNHVKSLYRDTQMAFSMVYNNRLLTDYNTTPELQDLVNEYETVISDITKTNLQAQVAYVSVDLPGSRIMMHRLHPNIVAQVQVPMGTWHENLSYSMCVLDEINQAASEDYQPIKEITKKDTISADYKQDLANIFLNTPRAFVGMLETVPDNTIREVLVMSFQTKTF